MREFSAKSKLVIRAIGTSLVVFCLLILPLLGSAKGLGPLVCVQAKSKVRHSCAHCNANDSMLKANVWSGANNGGETDPSVSGVSVPKPKASLTPGESCCHPPTKVVEKPQVERAEHKAAPVLSPVDTKCECEMAPAQSRPDTDGQLSPGFSFEPIAYATTLPLTEIAPEYPGGDVPAKPTRGPPETNGRLGPPDRAPPVL